MVNFTSPYLESDAWLMSRFGETFSLFPVSTCAADKKVQWPSTTVTNDSDTSQKQQPWSRPTSPYALHAEYFAQSRAYQYKWWQRTCSNRRFVRFVNVYCKCVLDKRLKALFLLPHSLFGFPQSYIWGIPWTGWAKPAGGGSAPRIGTMWVEWVTLGTPPSGGSRNLTLWEFLAEICLMYTTHVRLPTHQVSSNSIYCNKNYT